MKALLTLAAITTLSVTGTPAIAGLADGYQVQEQQVDYEAQKCQYWHDNGQFYDTDDLGTQYRYFIGEDNGVVKTYINQFSAFVGDYLECEHVGYLNVTTTQPGLFGGRVEWKIEGNQLVKYKQLSDGTIQRYNRGYLISQ